jgi:hypothetical protein
MLQFEVQAFTRDGKRIKSEVQTAEASLPATSRTEAVTTGVKLRLIIL